jgi:hypothetical protein
MATATDSIHPSQVKDLRGRRFTHLVVIEPAPTKGVGARWVCRCDCGQLKIVAATHLVQETIKSCGCFRNQLIGHANSTHGATHTPEFKIWSGMLDRTTNPRGKAYARYGARGIGVSDQWRSFSTFIADMGLRPSAEHSLDRINNDASYSRENCRWATRLEQARNRNGNHRLDFHGENLTLVEWTARLGFTKNVLISRLRLGWTVERTLTTPLLRIRKSWRISPPA